MIKVCAYTYAYTYTILPTQPYARPGGRPRTTYILRTYKNTTLGKFLYLLTYVHMFVSLCSIPSAVFLWLSIYTLGE